MVIAILLSIASNSNAQEEKGSSAFGYVSAGYTQFQIDREFSIGSGEDNLGAFGFELFGGYRISEKLFIDAGLFSTNTFSFLVGGDDYHLSEYSLNISYAFLIGDRISLVPRIGYAYWEMETEEGLFLNPGPEEITEFYGNNFVYSLGLEKVSSSNSALFLSVKSGHYEFGEITSFNLGVRFPL